MRGAGADVGKSESRPLLRLTGSRQHGSFKSGLAAQQCISFGLYKNERFQAAVEVASNSGFLLGSYEFIGRHLRFAAERTVGARILFGADVKQRFVVCVRLQRGCDRCSISSERCSRRQSVRLQAAWTWHYWPPSWYIALARR